jgi:hypothetical protein
MKIGRLIEYLLPYLVAWFTNRKIGKKFNKKNWESLSDYWKQAITGERIHTLEKAVEDLYHSETERRETIESKAASLFEAIGFAVSLVSIAILFAEKRTLLALLLFPLVNFILAGICSWHATKIGEFFLPTLEGIKENIELAKKKQKDNSKSHWIIEKLVSTEMNYPFILIKSNWLAAAHQHFMLGMLLVIICFVITVLEPQFMQFLKMFS